MRPMTELEEYYNKFNEEKRLNSRHGQVEFRVSMKYIHEYLESFLKDGRKKSEIKILDIGAGNIFHDTHKKLVDAFTGMLFVY